MNASATIYPGVQIYIGNSIYYVREEIQHSTLLRKMEKYKLPLTWENIRVDDMPIRPIDYQVLIPKTQQVSKENQILNDKLRLEHQQLVQQDQRNIQLKCKSE